MEKGNVKLLIVDDEAELLRHLHQYLMACGFQQIYTAKNLAQANFQWLNHQIDLIILDMMLPDGSGMDWLAQIRKTSAVPVIILSALDGIDAQREGFLNEADDYITKPFLAEDLLWRIEAVLRRSYRNKQKTVSLQGVCFDKTRAMLMKEGKDIPLTAKQYKILEVLANHLNQVVSIDYILETVWEDAFGYENTLITHIYRLREKLEDDPKNPTRLVTVKGLGYKLIGDEG